MFSLGKGQVDILMKITSLFLAVFASATILWQGCVLAAETQNDFELDKLKLVRPNSNNSVCMCKSSIIKHFLSPGDTLSVFVYGEPEFTQSQILVRPDGNITVEPFGEIKAVGLSVSDLAATLKYKFKIYLLDPKVSVKLNTIQSEKVCDTSWG